MTFKVKTCDLLQLYIRFSLQFLPYICITEASPSATIEVWFDCCSSSWLYTTSGPAGSSSTGSPTITEEHCSVSVPCSEGPANHTPDLRVFLYMATVYEAWGSSRRDGLLGLMPRNLIYRLSMLPFEPEYGSSRFPRNAATFLTNYMMSHPKRCNFRSVR